MKKTKTLFEREMERTSFRKKYEDHKQVLELELAFLKALEDKHMTYEAFARILGTKKSNISRDLKGKGLRSATLRRIEQMAKAIGYDFLPLLLPRNREERARKLEALLHAA
jgi:transcriptional regulator with XRE-family HTH domain